MDLLHELEQHEPGLARRTGFMSSGVFASPPREMLGSYSDEFLKVLDKLKDIPVGVEVS